MANTTNFNWETPDDTDLVKDGAAAIRTLGNSIDTSFVDLKGGTTGQILSKASNTDLDYTWIANDQGDITEVQAGTGISVASGTGPIPVVTNTVATAYDAKGDLVVGTGADTFSRLAVGGTDGHTLQVDSSTATGLKWAAAPAGGSTFVGVSATKNAAQSINNATDTIVTFPTESYDTDGFHSTSTNTSRITIPSGKAGYYAFTGVLHFADNATGIRTMELLKNGTALGTVTRGPNPQAGLDFFMPFSFVANAAVSDYFEMRVYQNSGGALNCQTGTVFQASFLGA
jgi:hypothetical protein